MVLTDQSAGSLRSVDLERSFHQFETGGPGWTMLADGQVVGCAGLTIPWPGLGHAWLLPSPELPRYPRTWCASSGFRDAGTVSSTTRPSGPWRSSGNSSCLDELQ